MKTLGEELARRADIAHNIAQLSIDAVQDRSPHGVANLLRATLTAELWSKNEQAMARYDAPMAELIATLEARIRQISEQP